jgi:hypothetical protein
MLADLNPDHAEGKPSLKIDRTNRIDELPDPVIADVGV